MSDLQLIYNKETGCLERKPEPYLTPEISMQADFEELKAALEFYKNREKYVEQRHERWENGRCTGCGAKEVIRWIWYRLLDDCGLKIELEREKTEFCYRCGAKMDKEREETK